MIVALRYFQNVVCCSCDWRFFYIKMSPVAVVIGAFWYFKTLCRLPQLWLALYDTSKLNVVCRSTDLRCIFVKLTWTLALKSNGQVFVGPPTWVPTEETIAWSKCAWWNRCLATTFILDDGEYISFRIAVGVSHCSWEIVWTNTAWRTTVSSR